jgi:hypothetical protein
MSERSTGSQYDPSKVEGKGEQRRQQNEQSNQAGGQQGSGGGSMGAGPMSGQPWGDDDQGGPVSNPPRDGSGRDPNHQPRDLGQSLEQRSMGEGPAGAERDDRVGAMSRDNQQAQGTNPGPVDKGLADQVNQGLAQADPNKVGTSNRPASPNGSGSMGSTRRDDPPRPSQR